MGFAFTEDLMVEDRWASFVAKVIRVNGQNEASYYKQRILHFAILNKVIEWTLIKQWTPSISTMSLDRFFRFKKRELRGIYPIPFKISNIHLK